MSQASLTLPSLDPSSLTSGRPSPHLTAADSPKIDDLAKALAGAFNKRPLKTTPTQVLAVLTASKRRIKNPKNWRKRAIAVIPSGYTLGINGSKQPYEVYSNFSSYFCEGSTEEFLMVPKELDKDLCMCAYGAVARTVCVDRRTLAAGEAAVLVVGLSSLFTKRGPFNQGDTVLLDYLEAPPFDLKHLLYRVVYHMNDYEGTFHNDVLYIYNLAIAAVKRYIKNLKETGNAAPSAQ